MGELSTNEVAILQYLLLDSSDNGSSSSSTTNPTCNCSSSTTSTSVVTSNSVITSTIDATNTTTTYYSEQTIPIITTTPVVTSSFDCLEEFKSCEVEDSIFLPKRTQKDTNSALNKKSVTQPVVVPRSPVKKSTRRPTLSDPCKSRRRSSIKSKVASSSSTTRIPSRICKVENCFKVIQKNGRCHMHGGKRLCQVPDCTRKDRGGGLCVSHGGGKSCKVIGCFKAVRKAGFCKQHGIQNAITAASSVSSNSSDD